MQYWLDLVYAALRGLEWGLFCASWLRSKLMKMEVASVRLFVYLLQDKVKIGGAEPCCLQEATFSIAKAEFVFFLVEMNMKVTYHLTGDIFLLSISRWRESVYGNQFEVGYL